VHVTEQHDGQTRETFIATCDGHVTHRRNEEIFFFVHFVKPWDNGGAHRREHEAINHTASVFYGTNIIIYFPSPTLCVWAVG